MNRNYSGWYLRKDMQLRGLGVFWARSNIWRTSRRWAAQAKVWLNMEGPWPKLRLWPKVRGEPVKGFKGSGMIRFVV